jgi:hypothetical protein
VSLNVLSNFLGTKAGTEDRERATLWTTPWRWRTDDGLYVGHNKDVWTYMVLPLAPLQWEDPDVRLQVGSPLATLLEELGDTSRDLGGVRAFSRNREIHLLAITWEAPAKIPDGTPAELHDFLASTLDFTVPYKALYVGVKLRSNVAAAVAKQKGGLLSHLKAYTTAALGEEVPDLDAYENDINVVHAILARNGARVPDREELSHLESWYNLGRGPDIAIQETKDTLYVDDFDVIELAAVRRFERPVMQAPYAQWMLSAATHPDGPSVISVRGMLEPATVARTRLRRTQRRFLHQLEEQAATGDLERSEDSQTLNLAKQTEDYFVNNGEPLIADCSIVMARRTRAVEDTYIDELRSQYGIEVTPLQHRQLAALDETLPCSSKRVNPFLQDLNIGMLSYAGLQGFSNLGDRKGVYVGLTDPDYTPCWLDPYGAPNANLPPVTAVFGDPGSGKAQPLDAKILTPNGWVTMGDIAVGDQVIGSDGRPTTVIGVYPQGMRPIYRVVFNDGSSTECDEEHLWTVNTSTGISRGREWKTLTLAELRESMLEKSGKRHWRIPVVAPVQFERADLPLDPYLLGALLGDGGLTVRVGFSSVDDEILDEVRRALPAGADLAHRAGCDYGIVRLNRRGKNGAGPATPNPVLNALRALGLMGKGSHEKFIPTVYLHGSVEQRVALLQGLCDTDGYVTCSGSTVELTTTSKALATGLAELAQSLGGTARINAKATAGRDAWRVGLSLPAEIQPFRLSRKRDALLPRVKYHPARSIAEIVYVGEKPAQCIKVSAADQLYVTDEYVVTHNTFLCQTIATQATLAGHQVIMINPKGFDSLSPTADLVGGTVVRMSQLESSGGYFDPARYAPTPAMAAEIATNHIMSVLGPDFSPSQERKLGVGLTRGFVAGARCVAEALRYVDDIEVQQAVQEQAESSTTFSLGIGTQPMPVLGSATGGFTLIEFDRKLDLPDSSTPVNAHTRAQRIALAAIRIVTRASLEILARSGGGVFILDEAWTFLSSTDGLATLQQLGREGRSLNILPIFATQRVADLIKEGVNLEGYLSRVFVMKLMEEREARAALTLCGLEPNQQWLQWLKKAGPRRAEGDVPGRAALALHRDLQNRHAAVMIGPVPAAAREAFSTNPEERRQRQARADAANAANPEE